jgi:DNA-binding HxlR family transcriptional regulator
VSTPADKKQPVRTPTLADHEASSDVGRPVTTGMDGTENEPAEAGAERTAGAAGSECVDRHDKSHPTADVLALLGRAHATSVLYHLAHEGDVWRFGELEAELGVAPNVLSTRLSELTAAGLVEREQYDEVPPRVEYRVTEPGRELSPILRDLHEWTRRHEVSVDE